MARVKGSEPFLMMMIAHLLRVRRRGLDVNDWAYIGPDIPWHIEQKALAEAVEADPWLAFFQTLQPFQWYLFRFTLRWGVFGQHESTALTIDLLRDFLRQSPEQRTNFSIPQILANLAQTCSGYHALMDEQFKIEWARRVLRATPLPGVWYAYDEAVEELHRSFRQGGRLLYRIRRAHIPPHDNARAEATDTLFRPTNIRDEFTLDFHISEWLNHYERGANRFYTYYCHPRRVVSGKYWRTVFILPDTFQSLEWGVKVQVHYAEGHTRRNTYSEILNLELFTPEQSQNPAIQHHMLSSMAHLMERYWSILSEHVPAPLVSLVFEYACALESDSLFHLWQ